jgi:hypothetical protein
MINFYNIWQKYIVFSMPAFEDYYIRTTPFRDPIPPRGIPSVYEVLPLPDRPASIIRHIASKRTVEAITFDDFRAGSINWPDNTIGDHPGELGATLGHTVLGKKDTPPPEVSDDYYALFVPKKSRQVALLCEFAPILLSDVEQGRTQLKLTPNQRKLFGYMCGLLSSGGRTDFKR